MVISIQFDANVVTAEIARGDKRGTRAAKWIIAERVRVVDGTVGETPNSALTVKHPSIQTVAEERSWIKIEGGNRKTWG